MVLQQRTRTNQRFTAHKNTSGIIKERKKHSNYTNKVLALAFVCICLVTFIDIFTSRNYDSGDYYDVNYHGGAHDHNTRGLAITQRHPTPPRFRKRPRRYYYESVPERDEKMEKLILSGEVFLVSTSIHKKKFKDKYDYGTVIGHFCNVDWLKYKKDPSSSGMFRDLVYQSCKYENMIRYDLKKIVERAKAIDDSGVHVIEPTAFVFHESRCGSTLVANALTAMNPEEHRVYSESQPPLQAMHACGMNGERCPLERAAELLQDVIYLMGRSNDPKEKKMFFKIQSSGIKNINTLTKAFPDTPWIFLYRNPVQVLMSQFARGTRYAVCVHNFKDVPRSTIDWVASTGRDIRSLSPVQKCAVHLSTLCEAAIVAIAKSESMGLGVNYENLVNKLIDRVIPQHFNVPMTEDGRQRVIEVSNHYSKGGTFREKSKWEEDSETKEKNSTPEMKEASELYLIESYELLELKDEEPDNALS